MSRDPHKDCGTNLGFYNFQMDLVANGPRRLLLAVLLIAALSACAPSHIVYSPNPGGQSKPTPDQATYSWIQANILGPQCMDCHSARQGDGDGLKAGNFDSYLMTMKDIVPLHPDKSRLYLSVVTQKMPKEAPPLSTRDLQAIWEWIAKGAPNN